MPIFLSKGDRIVKTAIVLPAFNEEATIAGVMTEFHRKLPEAELIVINNNSSDRTLEIATQTLAALGAPGRVMTEPRQGKGHAVRRAFLEVDADAYILVDADLTYSAGDVDRMMAPVLRGEVDMVVGNRHFEQQYSKENKRPLHGFGNNLVKNLINLLFRADLQDIMSGYRAFNRTFVKNYPILLAGFQLETDMTLHALDKRFTIQEVPISYRDRPAGSVSKLNTLRDGVLVLSTIFGIFRHYKPLLFFSLVALFFLLIGLAVGTPVIIEYIRFQYIFAVPSAILACGLIICALLLFAVGLILDSTVRTHRFDFERNLLNRQ